MGGFVGGAVSGDDVVVAGSGAVTALGVGMGPLWEAVRTNRSGLEAHELTVGALTQTVYSGRVPAAALDVLCAETPDLAASRPALLAVAALREASGAAADRIGGTPPERCGMAVSTTKAHVEALWRQVRGESVPELAARHVRPARLAADLASAFSVKGPTVCVSSACVSGLLALAQGARMIRSGAADVAYVVGVDLCSYFVLSGFAGLKALDPEGCRPFDKDRAGISLGEGAGAIVLTRGDAADEGAVRLTGWGSSNDANHLTGPSRDGGGLALAIRRALDRSGLEPGNIDHINAHGTGTTFNDTTESLALRSVFGAGPPSVSASKGMFGHMLGAAGVIETALCVAALGTETTPGSPRLREPDSDAPAGLAREPAAAPGLRRILKMNCGFGGVNAALTLERGRS